MALGKRLEVAGKSADFIFEKLTEEGLSKSDAAILVSDWIFENFGKAKRTFTYREDFQEVDPDCVSNFGRTFAHQDWIDGESVVQAEQTTGEEGFNARFHQIEGDLDAIGADVAKAFVCMAEMRQSLHTLLGEIRAEINRLNSDIHECCKKNGFPGTIREPVPPSGGVVLGGKLLGFAKFKDKDVSVWDTERGITMLPAVTTIGLDPVTDPRANTAGMLGRFFAETKAVRTEFANGVTKKALVEKFGDERVRDGRSVRALVDILPDDAEFPSREGLDKMVEAIAAHEAGAIRTTVGSSVAVAAAFGLETDVETVGKASVDRFEVIPPKVRNVLLTRSTIKSMEELAKAKASTTAKLMKREGIEVSVGEVAEWIAAAKTLTKIR